MRIDLRLRKRFGYVTLADSIDLDIARQELSRCGFSVGTHGSMSRLVPDPYHVDFFEVYGRPWRLPASSMFVEFRDDDPRGKWW